MKHTVSFISLGCAKNQVDCEQMMYRMAEAGWEIRPEPEDVELVVINTCGFIDAAKSEAIENILTVGQKKAEGRVGKILVTGCLAQRYQQEILTELPEVDGVLGTGNYQDVVSAAKQLLAGRAVSEFGSIHAPVEETGRILTTPRYYSFIKIAEGCDNCCAFCVIPKLRGKFRSRAMEDVVAEAEGLAANGTRELIVVAQDTPRYGIDRNRVYLAGNSMGGQGALALGLPHGEVFAAIHANVPATIWLPAARLGFLAPDGSLLRVQTVRKYITGYEY